MKLSAYCKAVTLDRLRDFSGWREPEGPAFGELAEAFLHDDLVARVDIYRESPVLFSAGGDEWRRFRRDLGMPIDGTGT